jgi:hypothetical protein
MLFLMVLRLRKRICCYPEAIVKFSDERVCAKAQDQSSHSDEKGTPPHLEIDPRIHSLSEGETIASLESRREKKE